MRIALHYGGPVGLRAGRILLGERELTALGVLTDEDGKSSDERVERITNLAGWDVLVSDELDDPLIPIRMADAAGIGCVLWADDPHVSFDVSVPVVVGANLASGIAPALAEHEMARGGEMIKMKIAWTEPGSPIRDGEPVAFPDPVGSRWAREVTDRPTQYTVDHEEYAAPLDGDWAAALAEVTSASADGVITRIVGTADLAEHLEGLALAAAAVVAAEAGYPVGVSPAWTHPSFLSTALACGLEVAAFTEAQ